MNSLMWLPPIITGIHVVWFTLMTYWGYRQRKVFLKRLVKDREKWEAAWDELARLLTEEAPNE